MSNERDDQQEQDQARREARAAFIAKAVAAANPQASAAPTTSEGVKVQSGSAESNPPSKQAASGDNSASFSDAGTEYIEGFLREELGLDGDLTDDEFALAALDFLGTPAKEGATLFFNPDELNKLAEKEPGSTDADDFADIDAFAKSFEELEEAIAHVSAPDYADEGTVMIPDLDEPEAADVVEAIAQAEHDVAVADAVDEIVLAESGSSDQSIAEPLEEMVIAVEKDEPMAIENSSLTGDDTPAEALFEEAVSEISPDVTADVASEVAPEEPIDDAFFELMEIQALLESDSSLREATNQDAPAEVSEPVEVIAPEPEPAPVQEVKVDIPEPVEVVAEPVVSEAAAISEEPVAEPIVVAEESVAEAAPVAEPIEEAPDVVEAIVEVVAPVADVPVVVVEPEPVVEVVPEVALPVTVVEPEAVVEEVLISAEITPSAPVENTPVDLAIDTTAKFDTLKLKVEDSENYLDSIIAALDAEVSEVNLATSGLDSDRSISIHDKDVDQMMVFAVGSTTYAIPMDNVLEISEPVAESAVPFVPEWVRGVINLRGEIISLVDLRVYLNSDGDVSRPAEWMIIAQTLDASMLVGFIVDDVRGNRQFSEEQKVDITESVDLANTKYLKCVYKRDEQLILALEFNDLLRSSEMMQFQPV